jgi:hypothetical protein
LPFREREREVEGKRRSLVVVVLLLVLYDLAWVGALAIGAAEQKGEEEEE